jgi:sugar lactone lactonase YvrE
MSTQAELVVDARCGTGESPVWSMAEQALYWVDIPGRALHRWSPDGHRHWTGEEMLACIAPRADHGRILWLLTHERVRHEPRVRTVIDFLYDRLSRHIRSLEAQRAA